MRCEVPTAVTVKITVIWSVMLCSLINRPQTFWKNLKKEVADSSNKFMPVC
jgi:hypothetical protein